MLTDTEYQSLFKMLEKLDEEITVVHDDGFPTSDLTEAIDDIYDYIRTLRVEE